jgi:hypothetical protein
LVVIATTTQPLQEIGETRVVEFQRVEVVVDAEEHHPKVTVIHDQLGDKVRSRGVVGPVGASRPAMYAQVRCRLARTARLAPTLCLVYERFNFLPRACGDAL